jgi:uncharacterized DUF497 family protein
MVVALNTSVLYSSIEINHSALKHGFSPADINHVLKNALHIFRNDVFEEPARFLYIGLDRSANLAEVLGEIGSDMKLTIFHAMKLSTRYQGLMNQ